ncbi:MAG: DUF2231 domain-containing protein [Armatimonadetes bacterium]|nr:DUF2231 domain-containing protein [Armatimonadota bacterium]
MNTVETLQGDKWLGHPLHPALVALPIGLWVFSSVLDGIASITRSESVQEAADLAVTGGLVGATVSAATGIAEFARVPDGHPEEHAVIHGALNAAATGLFAVNALMRSSRRSRRQPVGILPKLLSLVGVGIIGYTGWIGGDLVFKHGIGVDLGSALEAHGKREAKERLEAKSEEKARREEEAKAHI